MRLLPAGEVFLQHGRAILTQVAAAARSVRDERTSQEPARLGKDPRCSVG
jgi:DNA-binding transcriptional LysR family regulator